MNVIPLGLQNNLVTSYDQTKTTLQGRVGLKTITDGNGAKSCSGPVPVVTADVFDDTGLAPVALTTSTSNNRIFVTTGNAAGLFTVAYYLLTTTNGVTTQAYQGSLKFQMPTATVHTIKGFMVDDSNPASMVFQWSTTNATGINGGYFACWGINQTQFVKVSIQTIPAAVSTPSLTQVVYMIGDNASQASETVTVADGIGIDTTGKNAYILNGAAATPKIFVFSYTNPPSGTITAGYTNSNFTLVTGTLTALSGVVLLVNNVQCITPSHTANAGSLCLSFLTSTNVYAAKVSDITSGVTSLPSLVTCTLAMSGDYITPATITFGQYIASIDKWVLETVTGNMQLRQLVTNDPNAKIFGLNSYLKTEVGGTITPVDFGGVTNLCITDCNGFAVLTNTTVGQRNLVILDVQSDATSVNPSTGQIYASLISPVISVNATTGVLLTAYYELAQRATKPIVQYRTSGFATGPGAGFDATWTQAPKDGDLSAIANATSIQFRLLFTMMGFEVTNPPQINECYFLYNDNTQISANWEGSNNNTTQSAVTPAYTAFRLKTAYSSAVPTLFFRAYDDSNNLVASANTVSNPTLFQYTTNNGTSWNALGTIPNTALTTEVRYLWPTPPGVSVTVSIRES